MRTSIFLFMKEGNTFCDQKLFVGPVAEIKYNEYSEVLFLRKLEGRSEKLKADQVEFLGSVFAQKEMVIINNIEEGKEEEYQKSNENDDIENENDTDQNKEL